MDDPLGLFDSDSTAFLDDLGDPSGSLGDGANLMGIDLDSALPQQASYGNHMGNQLQNQMGGQKLEHFAFDHDYGSNLNVGQQPMDTLMSPNHASQFGSPPVIGPAQVPQSPQSGNPGFNQFGMQHNTPPHQSGLPNQMGINQNPMWNQSPSSQPSTMSSSAYQSGPQQNQYIPHDEYQNAPTNSMGPNGQHMPHYSEQQQHPMGSPPPAQRMHMQPVHQQPMNTGMQAQYIQSSQGMMQSNVSMQSNYGQMQNSNQVLNGNQMPSFSTYGQQPQQINQTMMTSSAGQGMSQQISHYPQAQGQNFRQGFIQQNHPQQQQGISSPLPTPPPQTLSSAGPLQQQQAVFSVSNMGIGAVTQSVSSASQFQQGQQSGSVQQPGNIQNGPNINMSSDGGSNTVQQHSPMPQQNLSASIQSLQQQIQQLYNMPQTPETQQNMLDLQEQVRTLRAQQQQQLMQQQRIQQPHQQQIPNAQQPRPQTFIIRQAAPQQQQQQRPMASIVIQGGQMLRPGQTIQVQCAGQQPQTIRIQGQGPGGTGQLRGPHVQGIRFQPPTSQVPQQSPQIGNQQQTSLQQGQQQSLVSVSQQSSSVQKNVFIQQQQQPNTSQQSQMTTSQTILTPSSQSILQVSQASQKQSVNIQPHQVRLAGAPMSQGAKQIIVVSSGDAPRPSIQVRPMQGNTTTVQLAGGQQVQAVRLQQLPRQDGPRIQIAPQSQTGPGQQGQKVIHVIVKKPGTQTATSIGPNSISPAPSSVPMTQLQVPVQEITVSSDGSALPTMVTQTSAEDGSAANADSSTTTPAKPKRKRPSKKKSAEQEKADRIIQEAIERAKAEGREVPKVVETEDGIIEIPQPKKKSPKKKKEPSESRPKKEKKPKEVKELKPKPTPKPRPPKKKKTIPTFLLNKKRKKRSDESEDELKLSTPPTSPLLDDAFKRRSSRNTKRKKYLDELELSLSEDEKDKGADDSFNSTKKKKVPTATLR